MTLKCYIYNIKNYTVNNEGLVDVESNIILGYQKLDKIPLNFGRVYGDFYFARNNLKTLEGCPEHVYGNFNASYNSNLTSLKYSPQYVTGNFYASHCSLESLEYSPQQVNGDVSFYTNEIKSLKGLITTGINDLNMMYNNLKSLKYLPAISGDLSIDGGNKFPNLIHTNYSKIKDIIKYQEEYKIWNNDETLNIPRFNIMMEEITTK